MLPCEIPIAVNVYMVVGIGHRYVHAIINMTHSLPSDLPPKRPIPQGYLGLESCIHVYNIRPSVPIKLQVLGHRAVKGSQYNASRPVLDRYGYPCAQKVEDVGFGLSGSSPIMNGPASSLWGSHT